MDQFGTNQPAELDFTNDEPVATGVPQDATAWPNSQFGQFPAPGKTGNMDDEAWTQEEFELMNQVEQTQGDIKKRLFEQQTQEDSSKRERKAKAEADLTAWHSERKKQVELRKQNNQSLEDQYQTNANEERMGGNPWARVCDNVDLKTNTTAQGQDISRMKQAMMTRKQDLTQPGSSTSGAMF